MDSIADFDPYHKWLGIPPEEQPPTHYRLLAIRTFESDIDVIQSAADQRMAHVRKFQSSQHSEASQKILNELAAARVCLIKPERKSAYDAKLRQQLAALGEFAGNEGSIDAAELGDTSADDDDQLATRREQTAMTIDWQPRAGDRSGYFPPRGNADQGSTREVGYRRRHGVPLWLSAWLDRRNLALGVAALVLVVLGGVWLSDRDAQSPTPPTSPIAGSTTGKVAQTSSQKTVAKSPADSIVSLDKVNPLDDLPFEWTEMVGRGSTSTELPDFAEYTKTGKLVGLRYKLVERHSLVTAVQPVYEVPGGTRVDGKWRGNKIYNGQEGVQREVIAKPGYAVAGIFSTSYQNWLQGFRLQFMKVHPNGSLDASDQYESDLVGEAEGKPRVFERSGQSVVGICGRIAQFTNVVDSLGLVVLPRPAISTAPPMGKPNSAKSASAFPAIIDDGDDGYWEEGPNWQDIPNEQAKHCFGGKGRILSGSSTGGERANWLFDKLTPGNYRVLISTSGRESQRPVEYELNGNVVTFDRSALARPDALIGACKFYDVGTANCQDGRLKITLRIPDSVVADAAMVVPMFEIDPHLIDTTIVYSIPLGEPHEFNNHNLRRTKELPEGSRIVLADTIDDGEGGFAAVNSSWTKTSGAGHFSDYRQSSLKGATARWVFSRLEPKSVYRVRITVPVVDRIAIGGHATYEFFDGLFMRGVQSVNQIDLPKYSDGGNYLGLDIGEVNAASGTLVVRLTTVDLRAVADAISIAAQSAPVEKAAEPKVALPIVKHEIEKKRQRPLADRKSSPPTAEEYQAELKGLRQIYRFGPTRPKTLEYRLDLVDRLLQEGRAPRGKSRRFVALSEAIELASATGAGSQMTTAVTILHAEFTWDDWPMIRRSFARLAAAKSFNGSRQEFVDHTLAIIETAVMDSQPEVAQQLLRTAQKLAPASDQKLDKQLKQVREWLAAVLQNQPTLAAALEQLKVDPADRNANLQAGRILCLVVRDWPRGIPLLARVKGDPLARLVQLELAEEPIAADLGAAWYEQADRVKDTERVSALMRSAYWYRQACDELDGLALELARTRIREVDDLGVRPIPEADSAIP